MNSTVFNRVTFAGQHRGEEASVTFLRIGRSWRVCMRCGAMERSCDLPAKRGVGPSAAHAAKLLAEWRPPRRRPRGVAAAIVGGVSVVELDCGLKIVGA